MPRTPRPHTPANYATNADRRRASTLAWIWSGSVRSIFRQTFSCENHASTLATCGVFCITKSIKVIVILLVGTIVISMVSQVRADPTETERKQVKSFELQQKNFVRLLIETKTNQVRDYRRSIANAKRDKDLSQSEKDRVVSDLEDQIKEAEEYLTALKAGDEVPMLEVDWNNPEVGQFCRIARSDIEPVLGYTLLRLRMPRSEERFFAMVKDNRAVAQIELIDISTDQYDDFLSSGKYASAFFEIVERVKDPPLDLPMYRLRLFDIDAVRDKEKAKDKE